MSSTTGSEDVAARVAEITGGAGVDHVVEVDFGGNLAATLRCVRANGSIAIYATNGDRAPERAGARADAARTSRSTRCRCPARRTPTGGGRSPTSPRGLRGARRILSVAAEFPLYETAAAHKAVEAGGKVGTVVVRPND